jgi:hypothetical protein
VSSVQRGKGAGGLSLQAEKRERAGGAALTLEKTRWVVAGRELAMTMVAGMGALSVRAPLIGGPCLFSISMILQNRTNV